MAYSIGDVLTLPDRLSTHWVVMTVSITGCVTKVYHEESKVVYGLGNGVREETPWILVKRASDIGPYDKIISKILQLKSRSVSYV